MAVHASVGPEARVRLEQRLLGGLLRGRTVWELRAAALGGEDAFRAQLGRMFPTSDDDARRSEPRRILDAVCEQVAHSRSLAEAVLGLIALERRGGDERFDDWLSHRRPGTPRERVREWHRRARASGCGGREGEA